MGGMKASRPSLQPLIFRDDDASGSTSGVALPEGGVASFFPQVTTGQPGHSLHAKRLISSGAAPFRPLGTG